MAKSWRTGFGLDTFFTVKVKAVFKDSEHHKFYGKIVAHVIWKMKNRLNKGLRSLSPKL